MSFLNSAGLFNVIPDSELDHRWRMDEGSGTALADSVGSESASLTGAGWQSDANATGGFWTTYDSTNDYGQTDSPIGCNNDQFTVMMWFEWDGTFSDNFFRFFQARGSRGVSGQTSDGWHIQSDNGTLDYNFFSGGVSANDITEYSGPIPENEPLFIALTGNGDNGEMYLYDSTQQLFNGSGSGARGDKGTAKYLNWMAGNDRYTGGLADDPMVNTAKQLSQPTIEDIWQETLR